MRWIVGNLGLDSRRDDFRILTVCCVVCDCVDPLSLRVCVTLRRQSLTSSGDGGRRSVSVATTTASSAPSASWKKSSRCVVPAGVRACGLVCLVWCVLPAAVLSDACDARCLADLTRQERIEVLALIAHSAP